MFLCRLRVKNGKTWKNYWMFFMCHTVLSQGRIHIFISPAPRAAKFFFFFFTTDTFCSFRCILTLDAQIWARLMDAKVYHARFVWTQLFRARAWFWNRAWGHLKRWSRARFVCARSAGGVEAASECSLLYCAAFWGEMMGRWRKCFLGFFGKPPWCILFLDCMRTQRCSGTKQSHQYESWVVGLRGRGGAIVLAQDTKQSCQMWKHHQIQMQVPRLLLTSSLHLLPSERSLKNISQRTTVTSQELFGSRCSNTNQYSPRTPAAGGCIYKLKTTLKASLGALLCLSKLSASKEPLLVCTSLQWWVFCYSEPPRNPS